MCRSNLVSFLHRRPDLLDQLASRCALAPQVPTRLHEQRSLESTLTDNQSPRDQGMSLDDLLHCDRIEFFSVAEHDYVVMAADVRPQVGSSRMRYEEVLGAVAGRVGIDVEDGMVVDICRSGNYQLMIAFAHWLHLEAVRRIPLKVIPVVLILGQQTW